MKEVEKTWGKEIWFENNELYCGKLLIIEQGKWSSNGRYHLHIDKDETFFVIEGELILYIAHDRIILGVGESYRIKPGTPHRFTTKSTVCRFIEVSTHHKDSDSYRFRYEY